MLTLLDNKVNIIETIVIKQSTLYHVVVEFMAR